MKKYKILFLDIDNCLNHLEQDGSDDVELNEQNLVEKNVPICKDNFNALMYIIENVEDIAIVWSSSWRFEESDSFGKWKNPLKWLESNDFMKQKVIGKTPIKMSSTRFEEIHFWFYHNEQARKYADKDWMKDKYYDISNYAIIDDYDSNGMKLYKDHFFKCDYNFGLTIEQAKQIVEFLNKENFDYKDIDLERK